MMALFNSFKEGSIRIRVNGEFPERFINLCLAKHIPLWNLKNQESYIDLNTSISAFKKMRPILKMTKCSAKIIKKQGIPFVIANILKHKWLYGCLIVFLLIGLWSSMYIWMIEIEAPFTLNEVEVQELIRDAGLYKGVLRNNINTTKIVQSLHIKYPNISWVTVNINGVKAIINIEVRPHNNEGVILPGDIITLRDGYLEKLVVLDGTAKAEVGDVLVKGQTIVEGKVYSEGQLLHIVPARAIIETITWYYGTGVASDSYVNLRDTGKQCVEFLWRSKNDEGHLFGSENTYSLYKFYEVVYPIQWRNISSNVELVKRVYLEQNATEHTLSRSEAQTMAERMALAKALSQIGPITNPIAIDFKYEARDNLIFAEAILQVEEDITAFKIRQ